MDHDRLAMKWKDTTRVVERIIERVKTRSAKGDVFRQTSPVQVLTSTDRFPARTGHGGQMPASYASIAGGR